MKVKIRRAILSVSDKRGLEELARGLAGREIEILSTGGTARALAAAGVASTAVSAYTDAPEILDGRVKTLHPRIHGGLLARRDHAGDARELAEHGIELIDLVVVNLYPFEQTVARAGVTHAEAIENIDIGGPTMIRAAAKNHDRVAVVVAPEDYAAVLAELDAEGGALSAATRLRLATKAFAHTAAYDAAIVAYLSCQPVDEPDAGSPDHASGVAGDQADDRDGTADAFPPMLTVSWRQERILRYGENPHQQAAFYADAALPLARRGTRPSLATSQVLQGKELSYNNILDLDAALACCLELEAPAAVIVKHTNPCGVATDASSVATAYERARATDPLSAFGGIVAVNRDVDESLAALLIETFLECVIAPGFAPRAREILGRKKSLRLLATGPMVTSARDEGWAMRTVAGGVLVQSADLRMVAARDAQVVTRRAPTATELSALDFAWRVCKHVKSNAIVFCDGTQTLGIGAGQMSRVDSVRIARSKAVASLQGSCVASDAFFPFRDGLDALAEAGARAVIQPGGSIRDQEVIAAADEHDIAMVFTGMRHFRH